MTMEAAIEQVEEIRASPPKLLVYGCGAGKNRIAARRRLVPAAEHHDRRVVGVGPQLQIAAEQPRRDLMARRVDDVADQLALGVLRQRVPEALSDLPHLGGELPEVHRLDGQATEQHEASSKLYFPIGLIPVHEPSALIPASRMIVEYFA